MGGPSRVQSSNSPVVPEEVRRLMRLGGDQTEAGLSMAPITAFMQPYYQTIAGPNQATLDALSYFQSIAGGGATPGIMDAFNKLQLPMIQQQAGLAGLGRSGALLDAEAMGQASAIMPALQLQSQGAQAEAGIGDLLRQIEQQQADVPFNDFLRRQGITESLLSGATGLIPSSIGQKTGSNTSTLGILGTLFGGSGGK